MGQRQCPSCGKYAADTLLNCPYCREPLPEIELHRGPAVTGNGGPEIRRGLLWMLMAAVFYYFAAGYSPLEFPVQFAKMLTDYVLPLLFLAGLGYMVLGFFRRYAG